MSRDTVATISAVYTKAPNIRWHAIRGHDRRADRTRPASRHGGAKGHRATPVAGGCGGEREGVAPAARGTGSAFVGRAGSGLARGCRKGWLPPQPVCSDARGRGPTPEETD